MRKKGERNDLNAFPYAIDWFEGASEAVAAGG